jgi:phenylalanyl-tRNA synthetase beta chain
MKVSLSWLQDYVTVEMGIDALADALTMAGLEVEAVEERFAYLDTVVVGRIVSVAPHPNADRLKLCAVAAGESEVQVVCGAPNAAEGLLAPLAMPGSELPSGTIVEESTLRGQRSAGMLCSELELGLGGDGSILMVLDADLEPGTPLNTALGLSDTVFEIGLTPNRPDCLSIMGVAREIAALNGGEISRPEIRLPETSDDIHKHTSVVIEDPDHCPRYTARLMDGLKVGPSPFWLQDRLLSIGLRPINNLVDVTNYVMMETGQPLHAFDFDHLAENRIVVHTAHQGESFVTLDGKERKLEDDMLMICDGQGSVAVGGVMGGMNSEIENTTQRVLLESAYFNPISTRKTAKRLGLNTDASYRFERGVDPRGTLYALDRAAQLITELGQGRLFGGTIDECYDLPQAPTLDLSIPATNRLLGLDLNAKTIGGYLSSVGFELEPVDDDHIRVRTPSYRVDVSRPEDLMEEVARCHGYNNIPVTFPAMPANRPPVAKALDQRQRIRHIIQGLGFSEAVNYSFIHAESPDRLRLAEDDERRRQVPILNPLSEDQSVMRTSLIPGMLETIGRNISRQSKTLKLFEIGKVFLGNNDSQLPNEEEILAGCWTGNRRPAGWNSKAEPCDFFDLKGVLEGLLDGLKVRKLQFDPMPADMCRYTTAGASALIISNDAVLGTMGEVHPQVLEAYNIKQAVYVFEIRMRPLSDAIPDSIEAQLLPRFPSISRDATLIVDQEVEGGRILDAVRQIEEPLVEDVQLFDLFQGQPIPEGRKSISLRLTYRSSETTLEDDAVNRLHKRITERLVAGFKADLPV